MKSKQRERQTPGTHRARAGTRWTADRGTSLLEISIAAAVLIIVVGGTYATVLRASDSWGAVVKTTDVQHTGRETMLRLTEEIKRGANVKIDASNAHADVVSFQVPLALSGAEVVWGATKTHLITGQKLVKPGWWIQYRVVNRRLKDGSFDRMLVRRVLDGYGYPVGGDERIADHVDVARLGKKGFTVVRTGDLYSIRLRLLKVEGRGTNEDLVEVDYTRLKGATKIQLASTIQTRNWSADDGFVATPDCHFTAKDFFERPYEYPSPGDDLVRTDNDDYVANSQY